MNTPRLFLTACCLNLFSLPCTGIADAVPQTAADSNWTFTYLKATRGNKESLRDFVEQNWFVMDEIAVERGLFKSYRLIENISDSSPSSEAEWDYIVAVEYFGDQTYTDIQQEFEEIRSQHETVPIDGKGLRELGSIVRSERVLIH